MEEVQSVQRTIGRPWRPKRRLDPLLQVRKQQMPRRPEQELEQELGPASWLVLVLGRRPQGPWLQAQLPWRR